MSVRRSSVLADPDALAYGCRISILRAGSSSRGIHDEGAVWKQFARLAADDRGIKADVAPDAYLAAVAISHKARIATRDRGFGRFPGLRWFDPAAG